MISSRDISASQRLKCSFDVFFFLGIFAKKFSYSEETFGAFFALKLLLNVSTKFNTISLLVFN